LDVTQKTYESAQLATTRALKDAVEAKLSLFSAEHKLYGAMTARAKLECTVAGDLVKIQEKRGVSSLLGFKKTKIAEVGDDILKSSPRRSTPGDSDEEDFFTAENSFGGLNENCGSTSHRRRSVRSRSKCSHLTVTFRKGSL
jgi:hypothetical protein